TELIEGVPGVAALRGEALSVSRGSAFIKNLPHAGFPAWDLLAVESYREVWRRAHGYFSLNMAASRGCPFRCSWCAKPIWGNQYAQRSAESVAAEFTYLKHRFNPDHIWFADDIFGFRPAWVLRFAHAVREAGARVPF